MQKRDNNTTCLLQRGTVNEWLKEYNIIVDRFAIQTV